MTDKLIDAAIHIGAIAVVGIIEMIGTKMIMKKIIGNGLDDEIIEFKEYQEVE